MGRFYFIVLYVIEKVPFAVMQSRCYLTFNEVDESDVMRQILCSMLYQVVYRLWYVHGTVVTSNKMFFVHC